MKIVLIIETYNAHQKQTQRYPTSSYAVSLHMQKNGWGLSVWISTQQVNY